MNAWDQIKRQLQDKLTSDAFSNWVAPTTLLSQDPTGLSVCVPDEATRECMEFDYAEAVLSAIHNLMLPVGKRPIYVHALLAEIAQGLVRERLHRALAASRNRIDDKDLRALVLESL